MRKTLLLFVAYCPYAVGYNVSLHANNNTSITIRLHIPRPTLVRWTNSCVTSMPIPSETQSPTVSKINGNTTTSMIDSYYNQAAPVNLGWVGIYLTIFVGALAI